MILSPARSAPWAELGNMLEDGSYLLDDGGYVLEEHSSVIWLG